MDRIEAEGLHRPTRAQGPRRRRPRAARACNLCRTKKNKCDELFPCTYCRNRNVECVYQGQDTGRRLITTDYVRELEQRIKSLSASVSAFEEKTRAANPAGYSSTAFSPADTTLLVHDSAVFGADLQSRRDLEAVPISGSATTRVAVDQEVSGVNFHTKNVEFYGNSSSFALLSHVQQTGDDSEGDDATLVSSLHNSAFRSFQPRQSNISQSQGETTHTDSHHYSHCHVFIENFFRTIHYIHPILERSSFLKRCQILWSEGEASPASSFTALYYSILSLGALVGIREDEPIDGLDNIQWSRKFFDAAKRYCNDLGMVTDLGMVQCYFILAKVCQNELNPHLSYIYIGLAVRTALAMGINREPGSSTKKDAGQVRAETRTWWSLYSFEIEMSFAMGRPDTLGADLYHNRRYPSIADSDILNNMSNITNSPNPQDLPYCAIIKSMVDFSRVTRRISLGVYLPDTTPARTVAVAQEIERDLEQWVQSLPEAIRPNTHSCNATTSLKSIKQPQWVKKQRLVLTIRYHNLRILLFGSFLLKSSATERASISASHGGIQKCLESARITIEIIYQTYQHKDFFRTWFYNVTYTVFAAAIILVYVMQEAVEGEAGELLQLVHMAIEILEVMDECVVALEAAKLLQRAKEKTERRLRMAWGHVHANSSGGAAVNTDWSPLDFNNGDMDLDFAFRLADFDGGNLFAMLDK